MLQEGSPGQGKPVQKSVVRGLPAPHPEHRVMPARQHAGGALTDSAGWPPGQRLELKIPFTWLKEDHQATWQQAEAEMEPYTFPAPTASQALS